MMVGQRTPENGDGIAEQSIRFDVVPFSLVSARSVWYNGKHPQTSSSGGYWTRIAKFHIFPNQYWVVDLLVAEQRKAALVCR